MKTITEEEFMKDIGHGVERTQENWKEEFDKRFELLSQGCSECGGDYLVDLAVPKESGYFCEYDLHKIKDFISTLLAEKRNKVLSEVEREVEKKQYYSDDGQQYVTSIEDISTIINNLKVK